MARQLRAGAGKNGLILCNGGLLTYQYVVCLSSKPRSGNTPYPEKNPLPDHVTGDFPSPDTNEKPVGEAVIEVRSSLLGSDIALTEDRHTP